VWGLFETSGAKALANISPFDRLPMWILRRLVMICELQVMMLRRLVMICGLQLTIFGSRYHSWFAVPFLVRGTIFGGYSTPW
jgi:hypothetical protein